MKCTPSANLPTYLPTNQERENTKRTKVRERTSQGVIKTTTQKPIECINQSGEALETRSEPVNSAEQIIGLTSFAVDAACVVGDNKHKH